ncbi:MAG: ATP-binding protein [Anaerolineaceae bacterium]|nr:ATP-binding protein [Anaerolineaceae bacterium]
MTAIPELPKKLLTMIRQGENYQIEYKESWSDLPRSLFDTVCSFSNREGGDIFLGVHDSGIITGVDPSCC